MLGLIDQLVPELNSPVESTPRQVPVIPLEGLQNPALSLEYVIRRRSMEQIDGALWPSPVSTRQRSFPDDLLVTIRPISTPYSSRLRLRLAMSRLEILIEDSITVLVLCLLDRVFVPV